MLEQILVGLISGAVFGLYGFITKAEDGEAISPKKLGRTIVVYGFAGMLVGLSGDPVTEEAVVEATAVTVVLGEVFDKLVSKLNREYAGRDVQGSGGG